MREAIAASARIVAGAAANAYAGSATAVTGKGASGAPQQVRDPKVAERIENTFNGSFTDRAVANEIAKVINDTSLTDAQKQDYIAAIIEMAAGRTTAYGTLGEFERSLVASAFEQLGSAAGGQPGAPYWAEAFTPKVAADIARFIGNATGAGRLDADELGNLITSRIKSGDYQFGGLRNLLTSITDGSTLHKIGNQLIIAAEAEAKRSGGYTSNNLNAAQLLGAAADVANMAGKWGWPANSRAIIEILMKNGLDRGDESIVRIVAMASERPGHDGNPPRYSRGVAIPGRSGADALAGLLTSARVPTTSELDPLKLDRLTQGADRLFGALVRASEDGIFKNYEGLEKVDRATALKSMGDYFNNHISRIAHNSLRPKQEPDPYLGVMRGFLREVAFDPAYAPNAKATGEALANELKRLANIAEDPRQSDNIRTGAVNTIGALLGAFDGATKDYGDKKAKQASSLASGPAAIANFFFGKLASGIPIVGGKVGSSGSQIIDAIAKGYVEGKRRSGMDTAREILGAVSMMQSGLVLAVDRLNIGESVRNDLNDAYQAAFNNYKGTVWERFLIN